MNKFYRAGDSKRLRDTHSVIQEYRGEFRRDFARLIHSTAFRRLQGKTQLYPGRESDFFRNRLTHSLEVAQIAKSICYKINYEIETDKKKYPEPLKINSDLVEFAGLAHDLGHPPFGHSGEKVLDDLMKNNGGFEGNAQTLRILCKLGKKDVDSHDFEDLIKNGDKRIGLNLTFRSLAAILKYDYKIPIKNDKRKNKSGVAKGYYHSEGNIVKKIKESVTGKKDFKGTFRTIECQIMDLADDIAYSVYDLEDAFKAGFLTPLDLLIPKKEIIDEIIKIMEPKFKKKFTFDKIIEILYSSIPEELISLLYSDFPESKKLIDEKKGELSYFLASLAYKVSKDIAGNGYDRILWSSQLVDDFISGIVFTINSSIPALSTAEFNYKISVKVEVLKLFVFYYQIKSPMLKIVDFRGKEILTKIFNVLSGTDPNWNNNEGGKSAFELLPEDFKQLYVNFKTQTEKNRVICDFIAGMTDSYAIEFYGRLTSENPETIFKPF